MRIGKYSNYRWLFIKYHSFTIELNWFVSYFGLRVKVRSCVFIIYPMKSLDCLYSSWILHQTDQIKCLDVNLVFQSSEVWSRDKIEDVVFVLCLNRFQFKKNVCHCDIGRNISKYAIFLRIHDVLENINSSNCFILVTRMMETNIEKLRVVEKNGRQPEMFK